MTQKELIDKWRSRADNLTDKANQIEFKTSYFWEKFTAEACIYNECANDLEALTY